MQYNGYTFTPHRNFTKKEAHKENEKAMPDIARKIRITELTKEIGPITHAEFYKIAEEQNEVVDIYKIEKGGKTYYVTPCNNCFFETDE